jgi:hypothetical protein
VGRRKSVTLAAISPEKEPVRLSTVPTKSYKWGLIGFNPLSGLDWTSRQRWFRTSREARDYGPDIYGKGRFVVVRAPL